MFDVRLSCVQQWIRNYESMGADEFTRKGNKKYSKEWKQQTVLDYLAGQSSQDDLFKKFEIRSKSKLQTWIKKYNRHEEFKASGTGGNVIMTKGRKTIYEEFPDLLTINGYIEKFLKANKKTDPLLTGQKRFIQNHQIKSIEESGMIWNVIITWM